MSADGYFYSTRGGDATRSNAVDWSLPADLSQQPAWIWKNTEDEQIRHSPLIDDLQNIYIASTFKVRKYSPVGQLLWTFQSPEQCNTSPALSKGKIYLRCAQARDFQRVYALSMDSGTVLLNSTVPFRYGQDSHSFLLSGDHLFLPAVVQHIAGGMGGSDTLVAMNASSGEMLWHYTVDEIMWNFSPSSPGDGTLLFGSVCGRVFRFSFDGQLLWEAGPKHGFRSGVCSTGGGSVGPNGLFYLAHGTPLAGVLGVIDPFANIIGEHFIAAFNITNGQEVWRVKLDRPYKANQYVAVGYLSEGGPLAAVAAIGETTGEPPKLLASGLADYMSSPEKRRELGASSLVNAVLALDAATGKQLWRWEEEAWDHLGAAGDEVEMLHMVDRDGRGEGGLCLPDNAGIPLINTKDGTVLASSSHAGNLTTIRDANRNGVIEPEEVSAFAPGIAFLNSPSAAPGTLVVAPCWGDVYVFRSPA